MFFFQPPLSAQGADPLAYLADIPPGTLLAGGIYVDGGAGPILVGGTATVTSAPIVNEGGA
ncbi:MAG: hypothetical protein M3Y91_19020 [Actinomycetota bacterium]|nr:hypothetical protein [Actinomycetota bacterium]